MLLDDTDDEYRTDAPMWAQVFGDIFSATIFRIENAVIGTYDINHPLFNMYGVLNFMNDGGLDMSLILRLLAVLLLWTFVGYGVGRFWRYIRSKKTSVPGSN
jgi:hypothetical protein